MPRGRRTRGRHRRTRPSGHVVRRTVRSWHPGHLRRHRDRRDGSITLPVLETIPTGAEFYDYAAKRDKTKHQYRCPAARAKEATDQVSAAALAAHQALGCSGYSRSDFIVTDDGRVIWLEINTLPGLSRTGNLATMAAAGGIDYDRLIRMMLATADKAEGYRP
ncbi:hypothetical protein [Streptomyces narbonensis]|uniref:hypothetical protein n=1 Tax=Streptomyces narbonensis TaxID=67333 RepID=UPI0033F5450F